MKYCSVLFFLICFGANAQDYKAQLEKHRQNYKADFIKEERSPLKQEDLKNLHFFEADENYRVNAKIKRLKNEKIFKMPTYDGTSKEFIRYAKASFKLKDTILTLTLYRNISLMMNPAYKDLLFLPFTDLSNNQTTYGGGRYIDIDLKSIKNNRLEIDFNKAYNPYCAYSDGYRCPIPPEDNDLNFAILAGEKKHK